LSDFLEAAAGAFDLWKFGHDEPTFYVGLPRVSRSAQAISAGRL
jgi:hypothetical protein